MKDKRMLFIGIIVLLALLAAFLMHYVFSIYEVVYNVSPRVLYADGESRVKIETIPLNALGFRAPWRLAPSEIKITEGADLIEIVSEDKQKGIFVIKAGHKTGTVSIRIKAKHSLLPSIIEVSIEANSA